MIHPHVHPLRNLLRIVFRRFSVRGCRGTESASQSWPAIIVCDNKCDGWRRSINREITPPLRFKIARLSPFTLMLIALEMVVSAGVASGEEQVARPSIHAGSSGLPEVVWKREYQPPGGKKGYVVTDPFQVHDGFIVGLYVLGDQEVFLAGDLLKVDFGGKVIWRHPLPCEDIDSVVEYADGYLAFCTESTSVPAMRRSIISIDTMGNIVSTTVLKDERFYEARPYKLDGLTVSYVTPPKYCERKVCRGYRGALAIEKGIVVVREPMQLFFELAVPQGISEVDRFRSQFALAQASDGWVGVARFVQAKTNSWFVVQKANKEGNSLWRYEQKSPVDAFLDDAIIETEQAFLVFGHNRAPKVQGLPQNNRPQSVILSFERRSGAVQLHQLPLPSFVQSVVKTEKGPFALIDYGALGSMQPQRLALLGPTGDVMGEWNLDVRLDYVSKVRSLLGHGSNVFLFWSSVTPTSMSMLLKND